MERGCVKTLKSERDLGYYYVVEQTPWLESADLMMHDDGGMLHYVEPH